MKKATAAIFLDKLRRKGDVAGRKKIAGPPRLSRILYFSSRSPDKCIARSSSASVRATYIYRAAHRNGKGIRARKRTGRRRRGRPGDQERRRAARKGVESASVEEGHVRVSVWNDGSLCSSGVGRVQFRGAPARISLDERGEGGRGSGGCGGRGRRGKGEAAAGAPPQSYGSEEKRKRKVRSPRGARARRSAE